MLTVPLKQYLLWILKTCISWKWRLQSFGPLQWVSRTGYEKVPSSVQSLASQAATGAWLEEVAKTSPVTSGWGFGISDGGPVASPFACHTDVRFWKYPHRFVEMRIFGKVRHWQTGHSTALSCSIRSSTSKLLVSFREPAVVKSSVRWRVRSHKCSTRKCWESKSSTAKLFGFLIPSYNHPTHDQKL